jgi:hypothetical protein
MKHPSTNSQLILSLTLLFLGCLPFPSPVQAQSQPSPARQTNQILFEDKFDRNEVGEPYEVLEPDPNRLAINNGKLLIVATNPLKNLALIRKTFPGDFVATVPMTMQVTEGNRAGLYYWVDEQNSLFVGVHGGEGESVGGEYVSDTFRGLIFSKMVGGQENTMLLDTLQLGERELEGESPEPELWYIQLERKGVNYTGRLSADGRQWATIGQHTILPKAGRLGFGAFSGEEGIENAAEFGAFVVQGAE